MDKLDILNREAFTNQLVRLLENISYNKTSTCFAIDGVWGCGKSFVLDMLEEQLTTTQSDKTGRQKYFVIRYNSWKFDYYEEPLVAIVATMISIIEEKTKLFPDSKTKEEILGMLKATGMTLLSMANAAVKEKTGLDFQKMFEAVKSGEKEGAAAYESAHDYDMHFAFKDVLEKLSKLLNDLAKEYTIVILVDELDRCLPEYAIKVLERLHHLTEGSSNIVTIIAIDKRQLNYSIKQIFGFENPEKYLEKFISFEIKLDYGKISERIVDKYPEYIELFDRSIYSFEESAEECIQAIFKNIDIRTQEHLVKKAMLTHKLLFTEKKDYSFMCMELLLAVMICVYNDRSIFDGDFISLNSYDKLFAPHISSPTPSFSLFFQEKFEQLGLEKSSRYSSAPFRCTLPKCGNLYGAILFHWCHLHPHTTLQYSYNSIYTAVSEDTADLKKYAETLMLIK